jgi:iron complex transport system substrate-binding protein
VNYPQVGIWACASFYSEFFTQKLIPTDSLNYVQPPQDMNTPERFTMKTTLIATAFAALPVMSLAQTAVIETAAGEVAVPVAPQSVVALDLAALDTLTAMGVTVDGVPAVTPPAYLSSVIDNTAKIGTLFEPDFEALAVMAPDFIIAGGRSQTQVEPLSKIAPTINMTISGEALLADAQARIEAYGVIFQKEETAAALLTDLDAAIENAQSATSGKGKALILLTNGGKVSAYGDDSRFGWLHTALGLSEAYPDLNAETHGEAVSFEFIAEVNPDWIFVVDRSAAIGRDGEAAAVTLDNPLVAGTIAGQSDQIVYLDSAPLYLVGGGYQSLIGTIEEVVAAFAADPS